MGKVARIVLAVGFIAIGVYLVKTTPEWVYSIATQIGSTDLIRLAIAVGGVGVILPLINFVWRAKVLFEVVGMHLAICGLLLFVMSLFGGFSRSHSDFAEMMGVCIIMGFSLAAVYPAMLYSNKKVTAKA